MSSKQKPTQKEHLDEFVEVAKDNTDVWHSDDYWIRAIRNKTGNKDYIINQLNFKMGKLSWIKEVHKTTSGGPLIIAKQKKRITISYDSNGKANKRNITFYYATLDQKFGPNDMPLEDECQSFWRTNIKASWMRRRKQSVVEI